MTNNPVTGVLDVWDVGNESFMMRTVPDSGGGETYVEIPILRVGSITGDGSGLTNVGGSTQTNIHWAAVTNLTDRLTSFAATNPITTLLTDINAAGKSITNLNSLTVTGAVSIGTLTTTNLVGNASGLTNANPATLFNIGQIPIYLSGTNCAIDVGLVNVGTNVFFVTATNNVYLTAPSNLTAGKQFSIHLMQDATGGRTINFTNQWKFPSAQILSITTNANAWSILSCIVGPYATNVAVVQTLNLQ
jgi:hypothetical protein